MAGDGEDLRRAAVRQKGGGVGLARHAALGVASDAGPAIADEPDMAAARAAARRVAAILVLSRRPFKQDNI